MVSAGLLSEREAERAAEARVPARRLALPALAPHAADAARLSAPDAQRHQLTLRRATQENLESVAREAAARLGPRISVAILMADAMTGEVLARVGSSNFFDDGRAGWIDMTRAVRSPGSTLKPFIYGLAIEEGLVAQETLIEDRPANFAGYRPRNFDMAYQGDVSVRTALQLSLNVPAVALLDRVGPHRLTCVAPPVARIVGGAFDPCAEERRIEHRVRRRRSQRCEKRVKVLLERIHVRAVVRHLYRHEAINHAAALSTMA
jgi:penicillin-binding protein 1C